MTPVRIGIVGLGYWGPNLVRVLHELPEAEVVAVCDQDAARVERITSRYPAIHGTGSYEELLDDGSIDAIVVATGVTTHFALASAAIDAGKHVFVEKPMAASLAESEQLVAAAEEAGLLLMPGHTFLYSPPVNLVRELIAGGALGEIYFISMSRVNLGLHQSDVSVVWDLGPHDFSILRYWLDEVPETVSAVSRSCIIEGTPDVAFVNLQHAQGTLAHVELSWLAPSKLRRTTIVGSQKMIVYDDTSIEPVRIFDSGVDLPEPADFGQYKLTYRTGDIVSPAIGTTEPLHAELHDFCTAIQDGHEPRSSAAVGLDVVKLIEAANVSLDRGGMPVQVQDLVEDATRVAR